MWKYIDNLQLTNLINRGGESTEVGNDLYDNAGGYLSFFIAL